MIELLSFDSALSAVPKPSCFGIVPAYAMITSAASSCALYAETEKSSTAALAEIYISAVPLYPPSSPVYSPLHTVYVSVSAVAVEFIAATVGPPLPYAIFKEPPIRDPAAISTSTDATSRKFTLLITAAAFGVTSVHIPFDTVIPETPVAFVRSTFLFEPSFNTRFILLTLKSFSSSLTPPR